MKQITRWSLYLSIAALVVVSATSRHSVPAVQAQSGCTNSTLTGAYAFNQTGFGTTNKSIRGNEVPSAIVGVATLDGAGNLSLSYTSVSDGVIHTDQNSAGTYAVSADCTGSISLTSGNAAGITGNLVIFNAGNDAIGINTTSSLTATFDLKKQ